jgi:hypothetical protein
MVEDTNWMTAGVFHVTNLTPGSGVTTLRPAPPPAAAGGSTIPTVTSPASTVTPGAFGEHFNSGGGFSTGGFGGSGAPATALATRRNYNQVTTPAEVGGCTS